MPEAFTLHAVVNSVFMGKDYTGAQAVHNDRYSHGLVYFKSGEKVYDFKSGNSLKTFAGSFVYLPKFSSYTVRNLCTDKDAPASKSEVYCINIQCNDDLFGSGNPDGKAFVLPIKKTYELESIYKKVIREMYLKKQFCDIRVTALVYELMALVFSEKYSQYYASETELRLSPAVDFINENYIDKSLRIPVLSEMCNMSENYFRRLFTKVYGKSPIKYINERRVAYASEFLSSGLYSVSEVACLSGFEDVGYFSRIYKKITGENPSVTVQKNKPNGF